MRSFIVYTTDELTNMFDVIVGLQGRTTTCMSYYNAKLKMNTKIENAIPNERNQCNRFLPHLSRIVSVPQSACRSNVGARTFLSDDARPQRSNYPPEYCCLAGVQTGALPVCTKSIVL